MLETSVYKLHDKTYQNRYKELILTSSFEEVNIIHLTLTLNPLLNKADILSQYRQMIHAIKTSGIFAYKINRKETWTVHPCFDKLYLIPELTSTINIHLHGILICHKSAVAHFQNEFRRMCWNSPILGRQHSFNVVNDTVKDRARVAEYAFKDIDELSKFPDSNKIYYYYCYNSEI